MFKKVVAIIFFALLSMNFCIAQNNIKNTLSCDEFYSGIQQFDNSIVFDLRNEEQFNISRIIDANLADTKDMFLNYLKNMDKQTPIFIYCEKGKRSKECLNWLLSLEYKNVYQLSGGFDLWEKNNFPVDSTKINSKSDE